MRTLFLVLSRVGSPGTGSVDGPASGRFAGQIMATADIGAPRRSARRWRQTVDGAAGKPARARAARSEGSGGPPVGFLQLVLVLGRPRVEVARVGVVGGEHQGVGEVLV